MFLKHRYCMMCAVRTSLLKVQKYKFLLKNTVANEQVLIEVHQPQIFFW